LPPPRFFALRAFQALCPVGLRDFGGSCRAPLRLTARFARLFVAPHFMLRPSSNLSIPTIFFALHFGVSRALLGRSLSRVR
jgi:hypothetical protein